MGNLEYQEVINQSYDLTMTLSEIKESPVPAIEEVMGNSDKIFRYFSQGTDMEQNDFCLALAKNHIYEKVNRAEVSSSSISVNMILECADHFRTEITKKKTAWAK